MSDCFGIFSLSNQIFYIPDSSPCPSGQGCCSTGDICLSNSICQSTHTHLAGSYSGYYVGACSDSSFSSPDCPRWCTTIPAPDIVYNATTDTWACCGKTNDVVSCDTPTLQVFDAPAPEALSTLGPAAKRPSQPTSRSVATNTQSIETTTTNQMSSATTVSVQPPPVTGDSAPESSNHSSLTPSAENGLSKGAIAGVSVGASLAVLAVVIVGLWLVRRKMRRRVKLRSANEDELRKRQISHDHSTIIQKPELFTSLELSGTPRAVEMYNDVSHELPATSS